MTNYLKMIPLLGLATSMFVVSCQKKDIQETPEKTKSVQTMATIKNYDKLVKYLAVTFDQDSKLIQFNIKEQLFFVPNTEFTIPLTIVNKRYEQANEYKLLFEKQ